MRTSCSKMVATERVKEEIKSDACMCSMLISVPNVNSSERVRSRNVSVQTEEHHDEEMGVVRRSCIGQEAKSASSECSTGAVKRKSHSVGQNSSICVAALRRPSSAGLSKADRRRSSFSMCDIVPSHCGAGSIGSTESISELLKGAAATACNGQELSPLETGPALNQGAYDRARTVNNRRKNSIQYCMPKKLILQHDRHASDDTDLEEEEDCSPAKEDRPSSPPVGSSHHQEDSFECTANESSYGEAETEDETFTTTTTTTTTTTKQQQENLRNSSVDESESFEVSEAQQLQQKQVEQAQEKEQQQQQQVQEEHEHEQEQQPQQHKIQECDEEEKEKSSTTATTNAPRQTQRHSLDYSMDEERKEQAMMMMMRPPQQQVSFGGGRHGSSPLTSPLASPMSIGRSMSYSHTLKGKLNKFQRLIDRSMSLIGIRHEESIADGCQMMSKVLKSAWTAPKIGSDLAHGLCDYVREVGYLETLVRMFVEPDSNDKIKASSGTALVECLSASNREFVVQKRYLDELVNVAKTMKEGDGLKVSVSLFECLFKYSVDSNARLIELGALDHVLVACKATTCSKTLRFAALALANLSMYSDSDCQQKMAQKNVPDWLFLLASSQDDLTRYYACLAICVLVSSKEIEAAVTKSGTLALVEPFLLAHKPEEFAHFDYKHQQGRSKEWLELLLPMLSAKRREPRSMAAFHFALEASVKKEQEALSLLLEIGAVDALKQVCSLPDEVAPKFATQALTIIGEEVPYKLSQQVPFWTVEDVQYWASQIGFENYSAQFAEQKVDGDLLLLLTDQELERDIGMRSGLLRKRFMRELESLKMAADYSCVDETHLDRFLVSVSPQFSVYTYQLLELGVDRSILPSLSNEILKNDCGITNPMHRMKLLQSIEECKHIDDLDIAILSKHIDIFISYRRSTGSQLASLIKVLLQLRGHKVFIDVDRLYAGNFDLSLLKNIQAAKHFILVLTPRSLDRCVGDIDCQDWVHREVKCALEHNKNLIPVFDPTFTWPEDNALPPDIRAITRFNGVRWVHEYQEACVDKLEKFISGELNVNRGFFPLPQLAPFPRQLFLNPTTSGINVSSNSSTDFDLGGTASRENDIHWFQHNLRLVIKSMLLLLLLLLFNKIQTSISFMQ
ncbi:Sterile alpha and TIR motif-containing protein tir-1 [Trichinella pseudospiralis]|uniref:ADP-ribosyl cyclase/cyclic ADP-ribose hydrolase n=1 Tax=Trichinella pseudospiralis TaxID=6337 RepID=A0A0V0YJE9_TRIPS|nr:Sterile alpha and TIR motif-containing protein tir-1 [Trichinella pseudospiralis]